MIEPFGVPQDPPVTSPHWRESVFFVAHPPDGAGDALILTAASHPVRGGLDCYQMGVVDERLIFTRFTGDDGRSLTAGTAAIDLAEPIRLRTGPPATVQLDLRWTPRTEPHLLPPGRLAVDGDVVWEQRHLIQSGRVDGSYMVDGETRTVRDWWGQRDHSWGVRIHRKCPFWIWLGIQLPDGMLGVWCWEHPDGTRAYTGGCWAPEDGTPVPVTSFAHHLKWTGDDGCPVEYGRDGADVHGIGGYVECTLADGRWIAVQAVGRWVARYGRLGGGHLVTTVRTNDGRTGCGVYELTGAHHHRYFPVSRASR